MAVPAPSKEYLISTDWASTTGTPATEIDLWGNTNYVFDGVDDTVISPASTNLASSDVFSASWWGTLKDDAGQITVKHSIATYGKLGLYHNPSDSNYMTFQMLNNGGSTNKRISRMPKAEMNGDLNHWLYTANGTTDTYKIYKNAVLVAWFTDVNQGSGFDALGALYNNTVVLGTAFDGSLHRYKEWVGELTPAEALEEYNNEEAAKLSSGSDNLEENLLLLLS